MKVSPSWVFSTHEQVVPQQQHQQGKAEQKQHGPFFRPGPVKVVHFTASLRVENNSSNNKRIILPPTSTNKIFIHWPDYERIAAKNATCEAREKRACSAAMRERKAAAGAARVKMQHGINTATAAMRTASKKGKSNEKMPLQSKTRKTSRTQASKYHHHIVALLLVQGRRPAQGRPAQNKRNTVRRNIQKTTTMEMAPTMTMTPVVTNNAHDNANVNVPTTAAATATKPKTKMTDAPQLKYLSSSPPLTIIVPGIPR